MEGVGRFWELWGIEEQQLWKERFHHLAGSAESLDFQLSVFRGIPFTARARLPAGACLGWQIRGTVFDWDNGRKQVWQGTGAGYSDGQGVNKAKNRDRDIFNMYATVTAKTSARQVMR